MLSKDNKKVHILPLWNQIVQNTNLFFEKRRLNNLFELDIFQKYYFEHLIFSRNIDITSTPRQFCPINFLIDLYMFYIQTRLANEYLPERCRKKYLVSFGTPTAASYYFRLWLSVDLWSVEDDKLSLEVQFTECELCCEWEKDDLPVTPLFNYIETDYWGRESRFTVRVHFGCVGVDVSLGLFFVEVYLSIFAEGNHESTISDEDSVGLNRMILTIGLECFDCIIWDLLGLWGRSINRFIYNNDGSKL